MDKKERSRWEIILDVLKVVQEEEKIKKTRVMQKACLDWRNFKRHFDFMLKEGYITKWNPEIGYYELTENGKNLLERLKDVDETLH
ncbi:Winged helix-turn-helix [uncultured archaeon]|nr:Winged helix-turn-helix [uncultured archaeon]